MRGFMQNLGMEKGEAIEHRMVNNAIEKAQRKVEGRNFDIRKQLLEYDDVANDQRQMIYSQRNELIESDDISDIIDELWTEVIEELIDGFVYPDSLEEQWDVTGLEKSLLTEFGAKLPIREWLKNEEDLDEKGIRDRIVNQVQENYRIKDRKFGPGLRVLEKRIMLDLLDNLWKEHLAAMDYLRQGIHLRAYAQKQPKSEYKRESFQLFENLLRNIRYELIKFLSLVDLNLEDDSEALDRRRKERREGTDIKLHGSSGGSPDSGTTEESKTPFVRTNRRVGRNESCPCGSGEKFKRCHGKLVS